MQKIGETLAKLEVLGSRLSVLFSIMFVLVCMSVALFLLLEAMDFAGTGELPNLALIMQLISTLLDFVIYGAMLLVMRSIAKDVACGCSPFTIAHASQIRVVAWLFIAGFVLGILASPGFVSVVDAGGVHVGLASDQLTDYPIVPIDVKSVVGAVVCFSLSSVWKYGGFAAGRFG